MAFYRDTLGLPLQFQHGGLAFFGAGPVTLMLSLEIGKARTPIAGAMEVVLRGRGGEAGVAPVADQGATFVREPRQVTEKDWSAILTDPDGHFLTLFGPPGE